MMEEHLWSSFETRSVFYFSLKIHFDFYMLKLSTPAFVERVISALAFCRSNTAESAAGGMANG